MSLEKLLEANKDLRVNCPDCYDVWYGEDCPTTCPTCWCECGRGTMSLKDALAYLCEENKYNYHPYTSYCSAEFMVKKLGWKKCKEIVLENIKKGYSSKVIYYINNYQYEFFSTDLQHLLSFYYEDIPQYYK